MSELGGTKLLKLLLVDTNLTKWTTTPFSIKPNSTSDDFLNIVHNIE